MKHPASLAIETIYRAANLPCEVDVGPVGMVVYAATPAIALAVAKELASVPRSCGVRVDIEDPCFTPGENPTIAYAVTVRFDWKKLPLNCGTKVAS